MTSLLTLALTSAHIMSEPVRTLSLVLDLTTFNAESLSLTVMNKLFILFDLVLLS